MASSAADVEQLRDTTMVSAAQQQLQQQQAASLASADSFFSGWCEARRYTVQEVIGKGSYGVVCAAMDNSSKERVAIKKIQNVFDNVADATRILREIKLLRLLKHPDVVEIKHIMLPPDPRTFKDIYVVFELLESDLHTVIGANDDLTQDHHKVFLYQLLRGLNFIHSSGVLHRDLKPKNILANSNCKLKICDFGLARPLLTKDGVSPVHWTDYVATRWYRAPELCGCFYGRYSPAVDIWSIGCIFAEVLLGKPLFPGRDAVSQLQLVTDLLGKPSQETIDRIGNQKARAFLNALPPKQPKPFEQKFPNACPEALALLKRLLAFDPKDRPTAAQALIDPYFASLPNARVQDPASYGPEQFEFERHKLDTAEVRALIYQEALMYHPLVAAAYHAQQGLTCYPLQPGVALSVPGGDMELRQQFRVVEQQQQTAAMQAAATGSTSSSYEQPCVLPHAHPGAHLVAYGEGPVSTPHTYTHLNQQQHAYEQQLHLAQQQQRQAHHYALTVPLPMPMPVGAGPAVPLPGPGLGPGAPHPSGLLLSSGAGAGAPPDPAAYGAAMLWYKQQALAPQGMHGVHEAMATLTPEQQAAVLQYSTAQTHLYQHQQRLALQAQAAALAQAMGH